MRRALLLAGMCVLGANALVWMFEPVGVGATGKAALRIIRRE